ncbi:hypothetical protein D915_005041 [Fasciola hepatica]|uniref:Uncharacterized protein n=1 Tax=Fasciola hepatica TaxID=6192 RepID=A0A4E0RSW8_FASHE|nr:hypothetical protein D915_005041 [Fasciola hepatica]
MPHDFARSNKLGTRRWRRSGTGAPLYVPSFYYPAKRRCQGRGQTSCRLCKESVPTAPKITVVSQRNKPSLEAPHIPSRRPRSFTYACETWPLRVDNAKRLESFDHWCLCYMAKIKWYDRVSSSAVRQQCEYGKTFFSPPATSPTAVRSCPSATENGVYCHHSTQTGNVALVANRRHGLVLLERRWIT